MVTMLLSALISAVVSILYVKASSVITKWHCDGPSNADGLCSQAKRHGACSRGRLHQCLPIAPDYCSPTDHPISGFDHTTFGGHLYFFKTVDVNTYSTWESFREICTGLSPYSYLVAIESEAEQQHVVGIAHQNGCSKLITGGRRLVPGGDFHWHLDGSKTKPFTYTSWSDGEPNNVDNVEDMMFIWHGSSMWEDTPSIFTDHYGWQNLVFCLLCEYQ